MARTPKKPDGLTQEQWELQLAGERIRFAGGNLDSSEQDREIAHWIDKRPGSAWTIMKYILHEHITGKLMMVQPGMGNIVSTKDQEEQGEFGEASDILSQFPD